jgi:hypothetical protein
MTEHSNPAADIIGRATVSEHRPKHDMSCMAATRFCLSGVMFVSFHRSARAVAGTRGALSVK